MLKKKIVTSTMLQRNRNHHFWHVSSISGYALGRNLFHQGRSEFFPYQLLVERPEQHHGKDFGEAEVRMHKVTEKMHVYQSVVRGRLCGK